MNISLLPNSIYSNGFININSSIMATFMVTLLIGIMALIINKNVALIPGRFQYSIEAILSVFYSKSCDSTQDQKYRIYYTSIVLSLFIFIFISNQFSLIPLIQSLVTESGVVFRTPTSHYSQTITLALTTVILANVTALMISPIKHLDNLFFIKSFISIRSFKEIPSLILNAFLALLNIIGETSKIISLASRLFGNIFAGEVMVAVIAGLSIYTAFFLPIPFMLISIFSGIIQAFVFSLLAFSFITGSVESVKEK